MRSTLRGFVVSLAILVVPGVCAAGTVAYPAGSEQQVLALINQVRQQHRLPGLALSQALRGVARAHSLGMLQSGAFEHSSPGASPGALISRSAKGTVSGETLAWGVGSYGSPAGLVGQWMRSPEHRAVLLSPLVRRVGIGIATGSFSGARNAVMATAEFSS